MATTTRPDCTYGCVSGKLFNRALKTYVQCPDCAAVRKEEVAKGETVEGENLADVLGFGKGLLGETYVWDALIPDGEKEFLEQESLTQVAEALDRLYGSFSLGKSLTSSVCIGLGIKGKLLKLVYPMMVQAYKNGLTVAPFISATEFSRLMSSGSDISSWLDSEVAFVLINEGISLGDSASAKGLMQMRAVKGRATVFVTTWTLEACSALVGYSGEKQLDLAEPLFVHYRRSQKASGSGSRYINQLRGVTEGAVAASKSERPSAKFRDLQSI